MSKTKMDEYEQHARETLPEGYVFLGRGGEFKTNGEFMGIFMWGHSDHSWNADETLWDGNEPSSFYAAKHDSSVATLNRQSMAGLPAGVTEDDATPELFPEDAEKRKEFPVGTFITDYFPHAIAALAHHSYISQKQHGEASNGKIMEWLKDKSIGDGNQTMRHYMEGHKLAALWRLCEEVQRDIEAAGSLETYLEGEGY